VRGLRRLAEVIDEPSGRGVLRTGLAVSCLVPRRCMTPQTAPDRPAPVSSPNGTTTRVVAGVHPMPLGAARHRAGSRCPCTPSNQGSSDCRVAKARGRRRPGGGSAGRPPRRAPPNWRMGHKPGPPKSWRCERSRTMGRPKKPRHSCQAGGILMSAPQSHRDDSPLPRIRRARRPALPPNVAHQPLAPLGGEGSAAAGPTRRGAVQALAPGRRDLFSFRLSIPAAFRG
jgi:hypothetical protein